MLEHQFNRSVQAIRELWNASDQKYRLEVWADVLNDKNQGVRSTHHFYNLRSSDAYELSRMVFALLGEEIKHGQAGMKLEHQPCVV